MSYQIDLTGKVALVMGGAHGIGLATGKLLAEHGAKVVLLDISEEDGQQAALELDASGESISFMKCDVTSESNVSQVVKAVDEKDGVKLF